MSNSSKGTLIMIPHKRTGGAKFHMRQQMIKDGLIPPDSAEPEVRYMRVLTPSDRNDLSKDKRSFKEIMKNHLYNTTNSKLSLEITNKKLNSLTQQGFNKKIDQQMPDTNHNKIRLPEPKTNIESRQRLLPESTANSSDTGHHMHESVVAKSNNGQSISEPKPNMGPPTNANKKRKRKRRNKKQRVITSECYEPDIFPCDISNRNYGDNNWEEENSDNNYPACPSPASTGSLTQSIFQNNAYKRGTNVDTAERNALPFSLSSNSNVTVNQVNNAYDSVLNASNSSSNNTALGQGKTTITLTDTSANTCLKPGKNSTITVLDISSSTMNEQGKTIDLSENTNKQLSSREKNQNILHKQLMVRQKCDVNSLERPLSRASSIDTIDMLSDSSSTEEDSEGSTSLLENYCTANDFSILENNPENTKQPISTSNCNISKIVINDKLRSQNKTNGANSNSKAEMPTTVNMIVQNDYHNNVINHSSPQWKTNLENTETEAFDRCTANSIKQLSSCKVNAPTENSYARLSPSMKQNSWPLQSNTKYKSFKGTSEEASHPNNLARSNSTPVSSQSSASYNEEYLSEESKICLGKIVKVMSCHYDVPISKCVSVLKSNSFNLLTSLQELQLTAISSSELSEISNGLF